MRVVRRSALVPQTPAQMYGLVNDVGRYPEFLPGCPATVVHAASADSLSATLTFEKLGLRQALRTLNRNVPDARIEMSLAEGPFQSFRGVWEFLPIRARTDADGTPGAVRGCRVELTVEFAFESRALDLLLGPFFESTWDTIVDAFVRRAREVYP